MIPLSELHVEGVSKWVPYYDRRRPHSSLGLGIPEPADDGVGVCSSGHRIPEGYRVVATPVLGILHNDYRLEPVERLVGAVWPFLRLKGES